MPETSREFIVILPDDHQITIPVQPSLQASELLDMAASHCKIKEKGYFGLVIEEDGYRNWLELDKPVLDPSQEIPKGNDTVHVYLSFKYYIDTYQDLQDHVTVELLYLQCRKAIDKGDIQADEEAVFELAALIMQATNGPFTTEEESIKVLQSLPVLPAYMFEQIGIKTCEVQVIKYYKMFEKFGRGEAIFRYLEIVQSLPMYSFHYFEVKDKNGTPLWLGVGPAGIIQCPYDNRNNQTTHYQWMDLQNIYYKDKKFSVEVYATAKSPRKGNFQSSSAVAMQSWYGKNSRVVMAIWRMVRDQHIFYRNKRTSKVNDFTIENEEQKPGMSTAEILRHLNHKHHHGSISPSSSHSSLSIESAKSNQMTATVEAVAAAKKAQQEMYVALLTKREFLMEEFESKLSSYKALLLKEMQITGVPPEGLTAEEIEKMRTKFSINFKFSKFLLDKNGSMGTEVDELEKQLEVQSAIVEAQKSLVDQAKNSRMKKDRKKDVKRAEEKYQILEEKLWDLKNRQQRRPYSETKFDSPHFSLPPPNATMPSTGITRHSARHSSPNSSMLIDDNVISKMIFDDTNYQISPLVSSPKSPMHRNASTLQDVTEIPRPYTSNHAHRHLSGTQSLTYPSPYQGSNSSFLSDSNRSNLSSVEGKDSFLREYSRPTHGGGVNLTPNTRNMHQQDEYRQMFTPVKTSSPNGTPYHRPPDRSHDRSHDHQSGGIVQTHVTMMYPLNSSPEVYSPSSRTRGGSGGTFSPEPSLTYGGQYQNQPVSRSRPQSTHSRGTTPPFNADRNSRGIIYNKEMNLQEALMMDQEFDEGTLV